MEIRKIRHNKIRIALLVENWFPNNGSEQEQVSRLAKALTEEYGFEVDIFTKHFDGHLSREEKAIESLPGIRVHRLSSVQAIYLLTLFFWLLFSWKKYDVYHAHSAMTALVMKKISWLTGTKTILTVHDHAIFQKRWSLRKIIDRILFLETKYSKEISVTERFLKAKNVNEQIAIIPNGIDPLPFDAVKNNPPTERFEVLYVGPLTYQKGVDILLRAVKQVIESAEFIKNRKDFVLHIVGQGPELKNLEVLAEKLEINKYLRFYSKLSDEALIERYKNSNLFVLPSRFDGLPLALLQACASGLPIISTDVGDAKHLVLENLNGHIVQSEDINDMAYYLEHFALNPQLAKMGENSRSLIEEFYSWENLIQKNLRIYDNIIHGDSLNPIKKAKFAPIKLLKAKLKEKTWLNKKTKQNNLRLFLNLNVDNSVDNMDFLKRAVEFAETRKMPLNFFFEMEVLEPMKDTILELQSLGHEVCIKIPASEWTSLPNKKKTLRYLQEHLAELDLHNIRMIRPPKQIGENTLSIIHENGFEFLPLSEDPFTKVTWRFGLPFGSKIRMDLKTWLTMDESEFKESIEHIKAYWSFHKFTPFIIFECNAFEFYSSHDFPHASGENLSKLAQKLSLLESTCNVEYLRLSNF